MPGLLIRDVPQELHRRLKGRAARNRRSLAKEALVLLETALGASSEWRGGLPEPLAGSFELTNDWLDKAKREGRA